MVHKDEIQVLRERINMLERKPELSKDQKAIHLLNKELLELLEANSNRKNKNGA